MAYIPGGGLKKALNQLENPIYPDIKKGPPRFVWSRKHWNVDTGATMRDTEPYTQFIEPAVLAQSRNYNKTVYGQSSHKDIVNAEFRPPLLSYYEDIGPLSRVPATIHAIIPHINPGTAGHGGGTSGYTAKNERSSDIVGALTDRIGAKEWRPTFYAPMDLPQDNSVLPDLEMKLPSISVDAGYNVPFTSGIQEQNPNLGDNKLSPLMNAGYTTQVKLDGETGFENYQTKLNIPEISVTAGTNTPFKMDAPLAVETYELGDNRPNVSVDAGKNTNFTVNPDVQTPILRYNRPQTSVTAGTNTPFEANIETPVIELEKKLGMAPLNVVNPGSESGFKNYTNTDIGLTTSVDEHIRTNRPSYSYTVTPKVPAFRTKNEESHRPHFRQRLQTSKTYGQISQTGSSRIPEFNFRQPRTTLAGKTIADLTKRKVKYRF